MSVAVTVNEVIGDPFEFPGVHETTAKASEGIARTCVGAPGIPPGITAKEEGEAAPYPRAFFAATLKV
jgi:hypothetical protein